MQLLERELPERGLQSRRATVRLGDLASFEGVFLSNARGVAVVNQIDDVIVPLHKEPFETIAAAYAEVAWDTI
jgi:branched-subunit amino acid aminotransferase/4-amino-4-deoxychorismate lyase